jgi:selenium metabolism protein YedF
VSQIIKEGVKMPSKTILIQSEGLGRGDDGLGKALMTTFLRVLADSPEKPETIVFWNRGVYLLCQDSEALGYIVKLQGQGVEILGCSTCLDYFKLTGKMKVGKPTTMVKSVQAMMTTDMVCL